MRHSLLARRLRPVAGMTRVVVATGRRRPRPRPRPSLQPPTAYREPHAEELHGRCLLRYRGPGRYRLLGFRMKVVVFCSIADTVGEFGRPGERPPSPPAG